MKILIHCNPGDYYDEDGNLCDGTISEFCNTFEAVYAAIKQYHALGVDHVHMEFRSDDNQEIGEVTIPFEKGISPMTYLP